MTVTVANLPYTFCPASSSQSNQGFMFKNAYDAWFYANSTATATQITDIDYPGYHTYSATLTSVSTTATAVVAAGHGLSVNDTVIIAGASPAAYNGTYTVATVADSTHFTYTFAGVAPLASTNYSLIAYYEPFSSPSASNWPRTVEILGTAVSDGSGNVSIPSTSLTLTHDLLNMKVWLVPSSYLTGSTMSVFQPQSATLFDTGLLDYYRSGI